MGSSAQKTKAQHFVPQFYLKRFDSGQGVFVYDKAEARSFPASTMGIAQERYFYDLDKETLAEAGLADDDQLAEKALSAIEGQAATTIALILHECKLRGSLRRVLRKQLAHFMVIQHLRTRRSRENLSQMTRLLLQALAAEDPHAPEGCEDVRLTEGSAKVLHLKTLFDPNLWKPLAKAMVNHTWMLATPVAGCEFIASDHPIAVRPHITGAAKSHAALGSEGVEIAFPLSPDCLLIMKEKSYHADVRKLDGATVELSVDEVAAFNRLQVESSRRWLYSRSGDFADIDAYCEEFPHFRNENRALLKLQTGPLVDASGKERGSKVLHIRNVQ